MSKATTIQAAAPRPASSRTPVRRAARGVWLGQWNSAVTSYYLLAGATVLLLVLGLVMVLSSSSVDSLQDGDSAYSVFLNQAKFALMGLPFMLVAMRLRPSFYKKMAWPALFLAMGLQLLIFTPMARGEKGNTNWVYLGGGITIQPSELAKVALAVWLGVVLGRKMALLGEWKHAFVPVIPVAMVVIALVLAGKDLGTAMVLMLIVAGALFVAGLPLRMFAIAGAGVIAAVAVLVVGSDNRMNRIAATFGGQCDEAGACYQVVRGLEGLGTGGLMGVGLGAGFEKWSYLPEAHNDFIFAVLGEELGLLGALLVLALFALLGLAMLRIVRRHPDPMVKITTAAIACWIIGQALINIGVVIGILPVIGIPLPLVSAGGSALVATMLALGIVISFARDEPGAREALAARPNVVRRSVAVMGRAASRRRRPVVTGTDDELG
ncbi:putative lipid II flippase FtsW [Sanguibacter antarcticus]|uniref:Probable peptidoglycan glycosyltransferase FtsW n=1 Tax=Sanguibacter antarcticus TaxID=372484 RepID=A0A2A9E3R0_9MICO|nr:putative lipid II flippase FtsW [Sanguibacter antarcticus]PFG33463.1 cell division-specific peptidoglycan biosynthesis regulator FtsW [Sanguibacter antarcticus]